VKTADFFNSHRHTTLAVFSIGCLMVCQTGLAKREVTVTAEPIQKTPDLILNLPADVAIKSEQPTWALRSVSPTDINDSNQLVANRKKKPPLVDCGMDVYRNTGPDISLTSRLTGECDVKLHY